MNRHLTVIGAILKKDLRALWPIALINAALMILSAAYGVEIFTVSEPLQMLLPILPLSWMFCSAVMAFQLAHQDPVAGPAQDWLTRPISRLDLVAAKFAFLLGAIIAPMFLASLVMDMVAGTGLVEGVAFSGTILTMAFYAPPLLAAAAMTSNLFEALAAAFVLFILFIAVGFLSMIPGISGAPQVVGSGFGWIASNVSFSIFVALSIGLLVLLYGYRKLKLARLLALPAIAFVAGVVYLFPWDTAVALQRAASPKVDGPTISLAPDARCVSPDAAATTAEAAMASIGVSGRPPTGMPMTAKATLIVDGVPAGWLLTADNLRTSGAIVTLPATVNPGQHNYRADAGPRALQRTVVPKKDAQGAPVPLPVTATLTLRRPKQALSLDLAAQRKFYPGFGWCGVVQRQKGPALRCTLLPNITATRLTYNGAQIPCDCVGTTPYSHRLLPHRQHWSLPASAQGKVEALAFDYHSTSVYKMVISSKVQSDPASVCPADAPAQANSDVTSSVTIRGK